MRQMGGSYLYSFDIAVMLFGVGLNLAGLPYSAGFLGKEFLLFQVLRDDFLSLVTRGCWLVSFFFTPIYMLILVFRVAFGLKKGSVVAYRSGWSSILYQQAYAIFIKVGKKDTLINSKLFLYRFQFTTITSRKTSYVLVYFWIFFFFFGESLLLITFNFTTPIDTINSHSFFGIKQHIIFLTDSLSSKLTSTISFYIFFLTSFSVLYLFNLNYSLSYNYFRQATLFSVLPFIFFFYALF